MFVPSTPGKLERKIQFYRPEHMAEKFFLDTDNDLNVNSSISCHKYHGLILSILFFPSYVGREKYSEHSVLRKIVPAYFQPLCHAVFEPSHHLSGLQCYLHTQKAELDDLHLKDAFSEDVTKKLHNLIYSAGMLEILFLLFAKLGEYALLKLSIALGGLRTVTCGIPVPFLYLFQDVAEEMEHMLVISQRICETEIWAVLKKVKMRRSQDKSAKGKSSELDKDGHKYSENKISTWYDPAHNNGKSLQDLIQNKSELCHQQDHEKTLKKDKCSTNQVVFLSNENSQRLETFNNIKNDNNTVFHSLQSSSGNDAQDAKESHYVSVKQDLLGELARISAGESLAAGQFTLFTKDLPIFDEGHASEHHVQEPLESGHLHLGNRKSLHWTLQFVRHEPLNTTFHQNPPVENETLHHETIHQSMQQRVFRIASMVHLASSLPVPVTQLADIGIYYDEGEDEMCCCKCQWRMPRAEFEILNNHLHIHSCSQFLKDTDSAPDETGNSTGSAT